ncbi:hypothetical protein P3T73_17385 [Kiritimatiellota bacterium B12222]|nr:hypothetical protein P3T73_17385 [Kiritimatiellota bacterium B12222]
MKKVLVTLFALSLAGSIYAGSGCGSSCSSKSSKKTADTIEKEVIAQGADSKECDSSTKTCTGKEKAQDS